MNTDPKYSPEDEAINDSFRKHYDGRCVLVTGAGGFLGTNAVLRLLDLNAKVTVFMRKPPRPIFDLDRIKFIQGDLHDADLVRSAVAGQDTVMDLAGVSGAVASNVDPFSHLQLECRAHLNLFQACAAIAPCPVVIFCSSRLVYGKPDYLPVDESHRLAPMNIYAVHKITLENYLQVFNRTHGLPYCILRLSNPYGPHQPPSTEQYGIINRFIQMACSGVPITVFGDGSQKRDYVFVDDVVNAFLATAMTATCHAKTFNLGGREEISIQAAVDDISREVSGVEVVRRPWPDAFQRIETGDYRSDMSKLDAHVRLPTPCNWVEGLRRTLDYYHNSTITEGDRV